MNKQNLRDSIGKRDEDISESGERSKMTPKRRLPRAWISAAAAVLAVGVLAGVCAEPLKSLLREKHARHDNEVITGTPAIIQGAETLSTAVYPKMARFPKEVTETYDEEYMTWRLSHNKQMQEDGYADSLKPFFAKSISQFLAADDIENPLFSPVNVYMALAMLAEITDGESRQQVLALLGNRDIAEVRRQANAVWNAQYCDDGVTSSILGNSLWLRDDMEYNRETLELLAKNYYASSYRGKMGSDKFNRALHEWMNRQTNSLLKNQVDGIKMKPEMIASIVSTLYFRAKWEDEFDTGQTKKEVFHSVNGDITCDFMHEQRSGSYYAGERFTAVTKCFDNGEGSMMFLLPNDGEHISDLLTDEETLAFLAGERGKSDFQTAMIRLAVPKFDVEAKSELIPGLQSLGVTDVFDLSRADFSPLFSDAAFISSVQHGVRVKLDEKGVEAAAYTVMMLEAGAARPDKIVDFTLDRPFLFVIYSRDGLPLFTGVVNRP